MCEVYEALDIIRCIKCYDFYHVATNCTSPVSCAKFSGNHRTTDCNSIEANCLKCKKAALSLKVEVDSSHPAWRENCRVFSDKGEKSIMIVKICCS